MYFFIKINYVWEFILYGEFLHQYAKEINWMKIKLYFMVIVKQMYFIDWYHKHTWYNNDVWETVKCPNLILLICLCFLYFFKIMYIACNIIYTMTAQFLKTAGKVIFWHRISTLFGRLWIYVSKYCSSFNDCFRKVNKKKSAERRSDLSSHYNSSTYNKRFHNVVVGRMWLGKLKTMWRVFSNKVTNFWWSSHLELKPSAFCNPIG